MHRSVLKFDGSLLHSDDTAKRKEVYLKMSHGQEPLI